MSKVTYIKKNFNSRLYTWTNQAIYLDSSVSALQLYDEDGREITVLPREATPLKAFFWLVIVAPTLLPSKSELGRCGQL